MQEFWSATTGSFVKGYYDDARSVILFNMSVCTISNPKLYKIKIYNLDAIISVGYRVNSKRGTQFRIWASSIIKDYLIKGYSINEQRLRHQNEQLRELQESVKMLGNVLKYKDLSGDMAINGLQTMH